MSLGELEILVDKRALPYVEGSVLEYVDSFWGRGFRIRPAYAANC